MKVKIESEKGFYVGDICYVLSDEVYDAWGDKGYADGIFKDPASGFSFAVAGTAYGDGTYYDGDGHEYGVDAGVIGIVPLEMVAKKDGVRGGRVIYASGIAQFEADDGVFDVHFSSGNMAVHINTNSEEEDFEDDVDETGFDPYSGCYTYDC